MDRSADWMAQAERDLDFARYSQRGDYFDWACFSAQQSGEKAAKAALQHMGMDAWGHSVAGLMAAIATAHSVSESIHDAAAELDKAYIPTRYPDALPSGAPGTSYRRPEAERLIAHAEQIVRFCQSLLPRI